MNKHRTLFYCQVAAILKKIINFVSAMNRTERHIIHLLYKNGYVEVPGIGALCSHYIPACFDGKILKAPGVVVSLDSELCGSKTCDQLVSSIARKEIIDCKTAHDIMSADIDSIHHRIEEDSVFEINNLGLLSESNGELEFIQASNLHIPGCLYPAIELLPLDKTVENKKPLPTYADTEEKREEFLRSLRRTASSAAAIAILAVLAFVFTRLPNNRVPSSQATLVGEQITHVEPKFVGNYTKDTDPALVLVFNTPADASCDVETPKVSSDITDVENISEVCDVRIVEQANNEAEYCLVVASLATEAEARLFIESTDRTLSLLAKDGRYRVYAMEGDTYDGLLKDARDAGLFQHYPSAWVCKR